MLNENTNIPMEEDAVIVNGKPMNRENTVINESAVNREISVTSTFSMIESIFAWLCLLSGYLFCRVFPVSENPLGGLCFVVFLFGITIAVLALKKYKFKVMPLCAAASAIIISFALFFSANEFLYFLSYMYALTAYCYFVYAINGNALENGFSNFLLMDFFKAIFAVPFYAIGHLFRAMFSGKISRSGKFIGKLILGLGIAVIPTGMVILLLSYDSAFSDLMNRIFDWDFDKIFSHLTSLILGIPIGMYLFGLFISSQDRICENIMTKEKCSAAAISVQKVPAATAFAAVAPILFVYVVFFVSQWEYYISGFTGVLPGDFSYADYAREGFFQLCMVAVINLMIILCVILFMRRKENKKSVLLKTLSLLYSIFTLILISTALAKLFMYIDCYGLTHKRIYAAWLMSVLVVVFVLIALYQFLPKLKVVAVSVCSVVALFAVLALANVDARIADYNVRRYIDGSLASVDLYELKDLGDAAIPAMVDLAEYFEMEGIAVDSYGEKLVDDSDTEGSAVDFDAEKLAEDSDTEGMSADSDMKGIAEGSNQRLRYDLENYLKKMYDQFANEDKSFWATTLPYIKAQKALTDWYSD